MLEPTNYETDYSIIVVVVVVILSFIVCFIISWLKHFWRYFEKSFTFSNFTFPVPFSPKTASKKLKENHLTARLLEISMCREIPH